MWSVCKNRFVLVTAMKADRKRLKVEKADLVSQMQQLYTTLESREDQLREFIRNYDQHRKVTPAQPIYQHWFTAYICHPTVCPQRKVFSIVTLYLAFLTFISSIQTCNKCFITHGTSAKTQTIFVSRYKCLIIHLSILLAPSQDFLLTFLFCMNHIFIGWRNVQHLCVCMCMYLMCIHMYMYSKLFMSAEQYFSAYCEWMLNRR